MSEKSQQLVKKNEELWREIHKLNAIIENHKLQIKENEKVIFKTCKHEWKYDETSGPYDRIKYRCVKCNLWRNSYMYC